MLKQSAGTERKINKEIRQWLAQERWTTDAGQPESISKLINRKLKKLMELERQGY